MTTTPSDELLRKVLIEAKSFACVGVSPNPVRPSHYVARFLSRRGYKVLPINPGQVGNSLFGQPFLGDLSDIEGGADVIDIFRRPEAVPQIVEAALSMTPLPKVIWMQIGVVHEEAAARATDAGLTVIQDRCPKLEYQRLFGELRMGGFATGVISSRR
jgi:predicted CoA-binding protein